MKKIEMVNKCKCGHSFENHSHFVGCCVFDGTDKCSCSLSNHESSSMAYKNQLDVLIKELNEFRTSVFVCPDCGYKVQSNEFVNKS